MYGDGVLRNNHDGSYFSRRDKSIPAGNYTFVRIPMSSELKELKIGERLGAIEDELKESREELKESREERAYEKGRYFVRMDALWIAEQEQFGGSEALLKACRNKDALIVAYYRQFPAAPKHKRDFPERPMFPGTTEKNNDRPSLAHLLPKDRSCTMFYGNAVALITGYRDGENEHNCLASEPLRHLIEGSSENKQVGIKNSPWNYLHLPGNHAPYFDHLSKGNGLIITPIWDVNVEWCPGTPYEILVVAAQASTYMWMGLDPKDMDEKEWLAEASVDDLHKATEFLKLMVKALADQLVSGEGDAFFKKANEMQQNELELLFENQTSNTQILEGSGNSGGPCPALPVSRSNSLMSSSSHEAKPAIKVVEFKNKLKDLQSIQRKLIEKEMIAVPKMKNTEDIGANTSKRVLKVDFAKYFSDKQDSIPALFYWL